MSGEHTGGAPAAGMLLVDKPAGPTSHDVVERARRALDTRRIGHAGTLDPFATGLLLLCVGPATRLVEYLHLLPKRYEATLRLGVETETHDPEGEVTARSDAWEALTPADVESALRPFRGDLRQRPPSFSAKRVGGRRAHEMARGGAAVELEPVTVRVQRLELTGFAPPTATLRATVGTGTYVRALARDLGRVLGCGAHLTALRRTSVGPFRAEEAVAPGALEAAGPGGPGWVSAAGALGWLPGRELDEDEERRVRAGARVPAGSLRAPGRDAPGTAPGESLPVALTRQGRLVAVAELRGDELQPRKVLPV